MGVAPIRLTIVQTHPVQYNAPWFRYIAAQLPGNRADGRLRGRARDPTSRARASTCRSSGTRRCSTATPGSWSARPGRRRVRDRPVSRPRRSRNRRGGRRDAAGHRPGAGLALGDVRARDAVGAPPRRADPVSRRHAQRDGPAGWRRAAWHAKTRAFLSLYSGYLSVGRLLARVPRWRHGVAPTRIFASPHAVDNEWFAASAAPSSAGAGRAKARAALRRRAGRFHRAVRREDRSAQAAARRRARGRVARPERRSGGRRVGRPRRRDARRSRAAGRPRRRGSGSSTRA